MRIFVTGGSGFIGSALVPELIAAGHEVVALARSDSSASALDRRGALVLRGDLDDLDGLRGAAESSEAVVHLANKHDFANPTNSNRAERAAVETIAEALVGSGRPFVFASGLSFFGLGRTATERDRSEAHGVESARGGAENLALGYADRGVRVVSARFAPTVHGEGDHGFVRFLADSARARGAAVVPGDGANRWSAVHRSDTALLLRLAVESAPAGSILHAVAEEAVPVRAIAEALAAQLDLPVRSEPPAQVAEDLGFIGRFYAADLPASGAITRELLDWRPTGPTLLEDIEAGHYTR